MQTIGGRLALSPSDLNDYLECPHLTTLALEVARGERARPFVADEHAELLRRKGERHERAYLERLRAEGRQIVEITLGEPWDFDAAVRRTAETPVLAPIHARHIGRSISNTVISAALAVVMSLESRRELSSGQCGEVRKRGATRA